MKKLSEELEFFEWQTKRDCREWINAAKRLEAFEHDVLCGHRNEIDQAVKMLQQAATDALPAIRGVIDAMNELQKVKAKGSEAAFTKGSTGSDDVRG